MSKINDTLVSLEYVDEGTASIYQRFEQLVKYWNEGHSLNRKVRSTNEDENIFNITEIDGCVVRPRHVNKDGDHIDEPVLKANGNLTHALYISDILQHRINYLIKEFYDTKDVTISLYSFNASFNYDGSISKMRNYLLMDTKGRLTNEVPTKIFNLNIYKIEDYKRIGTIKTKYYVFKYCKQICNLLNVKHWMDIDNSRRCMSDQECARYMPGIRTAMKKAYVDQHYDYGEVIDDNDVIVDAFGLMHDRLSFIVPYVRPGIKDTFYDVSLVYKNLSDPSNYKSELGKYRDEIKLRLWHGLIGFHDEVFFSASDDLHSDSDTMMLLKLFNAVCDYTAYDYHKYFEEHLLQ